MRARPSGDLPPLALRRNSGWYMPHSSAKFANLRAAAPVQQSERTRKEIGNRRRNSETQPKGNRQRSEDGHRVFLICAAEYRPQQQQRNPKNGDNDPRLGAAEDTLIGRDSFR